MSQQPQTYHVKLEDRIDLNDRYSEYHFELSAPAKLLFLAGQFVSIQIDPTTWRSYSISSRSDIGHGFEILVDHEGGGRGVTWLKNLAFGATVTVMAPLGKFILAPRDDTTGFNLAATGSGIAPMRSMIWELLQQQKETRPVRLFWGMRYDSELFWLDNWLDLQRDFPNFEFVPVISRPSEVWQLANGYITQAISEALTSQKIFAQDMFYLCGAPRSVGSVREVLQEHGVAPAQIQFEQY